MPSKEYLESQHRIRQYEAAKQRQLLRSLIEFRGTPEQPIDPELPGGAANLKRIKYAVEQLKEVTNSLKGKSHTHKGEVTSKEEGSYY